MRKSPWLTGSLPSNRRNRAENNYKLAERTAEDIKQRIKLVWEMLQEAERELEDYRLPTLDIHDKVTKKGNSK